MSKSPSRVPTPEGVRVVIKDTSCIIDLWKAGLLLDSLHLPYRFVVALPVKESEVLDLGAADWSRLLAAGLEIVDLDGTQVADAIRMMGRFRGLSAEDCFSLVLARAHTRSIMLTGDAQLRKVCETVFKIETHGVLWIVDQLHADNHVATERIVAILEKWRDDPLCFVPMKLIDKRLRLLKAE